MSSSFKLLYLTLALLLFFPTNLNGKYIHAMDEEEYTIIVKLLKGTFNVPVSRRTRVQKSAIVKYWRLKEELSLNTNGALLHQGKRVK